VLSTADVVTGWLVATERGALRSVVAGGVVGWRTVDSARTATLVGAESVDGAGVVGGVATAESPAASVGGVDGDA
jgi:hypothetical protein